MRVIGLILALAIVWFVGRWLVKRLGWPRDLPGFARWGLALLFSAMLFSQLRNCHLPPLPPVSWAFPNEIFLWLAISCGILLLAAIGYASWRMNAPGHERRQQYLARARSLPRRRALPPAPGARPGHQAPGEVEPREDDRGIEP